MIDNFKALYQDDRIYGKIEMSYDIIKGLKAVGRLGGDFSSQRTENKKAKLEYSDGSYSQQGGKTEERGYYSKYNYNRSQIDFTGFLNADYRLGDISLGGSAGFNYNQRKYNYAGAYVDGLDIPGWYSLLNTTSSATSDTYDEKRRLMALFAQAELGYKDFLFLNFSARNDWSSTLPLQDNSFFYGGVNASLILTELIPTLRDYKVDFLKVRAAIGQTGNDADVYKTTSWYTIVDPSIYTYNYTKLPIGGVSGLTQNNVLHNQNLKPEMTTEYEIGISGNFFDRRVNIDLAYYNKQTKDQIISAALAPETGYTRETRNVGK
jgi:outer membrane receptor protein involved in Fe transport